jgi:transcriptional regulator with XRE-family HTH domain
MIRDYHSDVGVSCTAFEPPQPRTPDDFLLHGEALNRLRDAAHRFGTQTRLASATGIKQSTLSQILAKGGDVTLSRMAAICSACGVSMDYILTGVAPEPVQPVLASADIAIASAESFAVAIDCLPVGKDIRARLQAHIQAHIYLLRRCAGESA